MTLAVSKFREAAWIAVASFESVYLLLNRVWINVRSREIYNSLAAARLGRLFSSQHKSAHKYLSSP